jgi:hypothetical protein
MNTIINDIDELIEEAGLRIKRSGLGGKTKNLGSNRTHKAPERTIIGRAVVNTGKALGKMPVYSRKPNATTGSQLKRKINNLPTKLALKVSKVVRAARIKIGSKLIKGSTKRDIKRYADIDSKITNEKKKQQQSTPIKKSTSNRINRSNEKKMKKKAEEKGRREELKRIMSNVEPEKKSTKKDSKPIPTKKTTAEVADFDQRRKSLKPWTNKGINKRRALEAFRNQDDKRKA